MAIRALNTARGGAHLHLSHKFIEVEIERLIALLDTLDGECDLEPSLGYSPYNDRVETTDLEGDFADWELDQDDEDGGDDEENENSVDFQSEQRPALKVAS